MELPVRSVLMDLRSSARGAISFMSYLCPVAAVTAPGNFLRRHRAFRIVGNAVHATASSDFRRFNDARSR